MKIIHLLFLLLPAAASFSQNYFPFIRSGVYRDEFWAPELQFCTFLYGSRYWFRGDSVINGQIYHKLCSADIQGNPAAPVFCPPYTVDTNFCSEFAWMREDTAARRVFRYDFDAGVEHLLFDFSVHAGDSVTVGDPPETVYVQDELYETWADGSSRRKLVINLPEGGQTFWIESLGAFNNIWDPVSELCICPHGICYQQNGQDLYGSDCAKVVSSSAPQTPLFDFTVNPNPAGDRITVQAREMAHNSGRIVIFDILGRMMAEQPIAIGPTPFEMNISDLPPGSYSISIWRQGKCWAVKRFQKIGTRRE